MSDEDFFDFMLDGIANNIGRLADLHRRLEAGEDIGSEAYADYLKLFDDFTSAKQPRGRAIRGESARLRAAISDVFMAGEPPMTVRQVFYALVSGGAIAKTEQSYKRVCYHLLAMRRLGQVPYSWVADSTRWMRKPATYKGLEQFLEITQQTYRRMLWAEQSDHVEIWCEKDALAGVLFTITGAWDVPLMVTRGFPSESFLFEAAEEIRGLDADKQAFVYYFGDYDPSGVKIAESTERKLREFGAPFQFEVVAVQPYQIRELNLPTRPTKKSSHSKGWEGESVELDAIPAGILRDLCRQVIEAHVDFDVLERTRQIEEAERQSLAMFALGLDANSD